MGGGSGAWTKVYESATPDNATNPHYDLDGLVFDDIYVDIIYSDIQNQQQGIGWSTLGLNLTKQAIMDRIALGTGQCIYAASAGAMNGNEILLFISFYKQNNKLAFSWYKRQQSVTGTTVTYLTNAYIRIYVR